MTRSPTYVITLVVGLVVAAVGWAAAALLERGIVALLADVQRVLVEPTGTGDLLSTVHQFGALGAVVVVHLWLLWTGRRRALALADGALVAGVLTSVALAEALELVASPVVQQQLGELEVARIGPTSPMVAGVVAMLVMVRRWIPRRSRTVVLGLTGVWMLAVLGLPDVPAYIGAMADVGGGMAAASAVALVFGTPDLQLGRRALVAGLAANGLDLVDLRPAEVDARGSRPWLGRTRDGDAVFVKALSSEQRAADIVFRSVRWLRLRRTGDPPPEVSLKRSAEHEAFVSHHVRSFGVRTPRVLAVAELPGDDVALTYEAVPGRSLDRVDPEEVTDELLDQVWAQVALLRRHGVAHRDLRLANLFLHDDGTVLLIDFGFAELSAGPQLLDTDVAELLAATSAVVGPERAVRAALRGVGQEALVDARDWLHPLTLSYGTRSALDPEHPLAALRAAVETATGQAVAEYPSYGRLSAERVVAAVLVAGGIYTSAGLLLDGRFAARLSALDWRTALVAFLLSLAAHLFAGLAFTGASRQRVPVRVAARASLGATVPESALTVWSRTAQALAHAAGVVGVRSHVARASASTWITGGLLASPVLVAALAAASLRSTRGYLAGMAWGLFWGVALAVALALVVRVTPWGRGLRRVWLDPHRPERARQGGLPTVAAWWALDRALVAAGMVAAMRAVGVGGSPGVLAALAVTAIALAWVSPAPGGLGAVEVLLYGGLVLAGEEAHAAVGVVAARLVTWWALLPVAWWARRPFGPGPARAVSGTTSMSGQR